MKIDKIEICNLASIEGEQEIDFTSEPLRSAGLFAITGNTGAGKSTILDAVCLALYNEAPRLGNKEKGGKSAEDDTVSAYSPCNVLRRGATTGYSRVTFSLNDNSQYLATWTVALNRNNKFKPIQRELIQLKPRRTTLADKATEVQNLIRQIVKLDYNQFTRTVILAQNSFANFLSAKKGEKSQLLEKITGTEIYAKISSTIFSETKEAEQQLTGATQLMEGLSKGTLEPEDLQRTHEDLQLRTGQQTKYKDEIQRAQSSLDWLTRYEQAQAELQTKKQRLETARQRYDAIYDKRHDLERHDMLQPFANTYISLTQAEADLHRLQEQTSVLQAKAEELGHEADNCHNRYTEANNRLLAAQQNQHLQQPNINKGRRIDGQMTAMLETLRTINDDLHRNNEELKQRQDDRNSKEAELNDCSKRLADARLAMQTIRQHQTMVSQMEYVRTHLQKMNDLRLDLQEAQNTLAEYNVKLKDCREREKVEESNAQQLTENLTRLQAELLLHKQANQGLSSHELQNHYTRLSDLTLRSTNAIQLWDRIDRRYTELSNKTDDLRRRKSSQQQLGDKLTHQQILVEKLAYAYEQIHRTYTLSQSSDVTNMRQALVEGSPCPLCGSTHHPYHADSNQQLTELMATLTEQHKEARINLNTAKEELSEIQQTYTAEQGRLAVEDDLMQRLTEEQAVDIRTWKDYADLDPSFSQCDENVNRSNRRIMLRQINDGATRDRDQAYTRLMDFTRHQDEINRISDEIKSLQQQLTLNSRNQTQIKADLQLLDKYISTTQAAIETSKQQLDAARATLDPIVTINQWHSLWEQSPEAFDRELVALRDKWSSNTDILEQEEKNHFRLQQQLSSLDKAAGDLQAQQRDLNSKADTIQQDVNKLKAELNALFGGNSVDKEADRLDNAIKIADADTQQALAKYNEIHEKLNQLSGQIKTLKQQSAEREQEFHNLHTELDIAIARFNNQHSDTATLQYHELNRYFSNPQGWKELRTHIDNVKSNLDAEQIKMQTAEAALAKLTGEPIAAGLDYEGADLKSLKSILSTQISDLRKELEEVEKHIHNLNFSIANHERSIANMRHYQPELEKAQQNYAHWRRLCDVLGSADGNAFREIAQSYTFEILVDYANLQLADLTPRYTLQARSGTLQLQVIDHHMLDRQRAVNTLSGGETFLLSLALALGLSALSSNNLEIGSLFIDEGFGNLDDHNLNLVIDALSNLQNTQHRQVGVISHTELIHSRISPKIDLEPQPGGKSKITIK